MTRERQRRLASVREGRLDLGPETLQLNLTNRCNLSCIFCWNHSPLLPTRSAAWQARRLNDAHLAGVMRVLPSLRPGHVLLSGRGEPLLHPGVCELLGRLQELGLPVTIQTNGVGGPPVETLAGLGVSRLLVNLSAGTAEGYVRTHPGTDAALFRRILARLVRIRRLGTRLTLVAVIQRSNADQLLPLLERCQQLDADQLQLKGLELSGAPALDQLCLAEQQRARVREDLDRVRRRAAALGLELHDEHLARLLGRPTADRTFTPSLSRGPCYMGWYYLRVTCEGQVMFCCKDKLADHLDRRDLYAIWRSPAYHLWRLAGRDGDLTAELFDEKCGACSNFHQNSLVARALRHS